MSTSEIGAWLTVAVCIAGLVYCLRIEYPDVEEGSLMSTSARERCYANRWHPTKPRCKNEGVWQGEPLGNLTDAWVWCHEHAPERRRRAR